jgi:hypothetical protein
MRLYDDKNDILYMNSRTWKRLNNDNKSIREGVKYAMHNLPHYGGCRVSRVEIKEDIKKPFNEFDYFEFKEYILDRYGNHDRYTIANVDYFNDPVCYYIFGPEKEVEKYINRIDKSKAKIRKRPSEELENISFSLVGITRFNLPEIRFIVV